MATAVRIVKAVSRLRSTDGRRQLYECGSAVEAIINFSFKVHTLPPLPPHDAAKAKAGTATTQVASSRSTAIVKGSPIHRPLSSSYLPRVDQHVAIIMATEAVQPPGPGLTARPLQPTHPHRWRQSRRAPQSARVSNGRPPCRPPAAAPTLGHSGTSKMLTLSLPK